MVFRKFLLPKSTVEGKNSTYEAWEFRPGHMQMLPAIKLICITCQVFLPKRYVFTSINYHKSLPDFLEVTREEEIVYSYFFIPVENKKDALKIMSDIKKKHRELKNKN